MSHVLAAEIECLKSLERKLQQHHALIKDSLQEKRRELNILLGSTSTKPEEAVKQPVESVFQQVIEQLTAFGHFINPYPKAVYFVAPGAYSSLTPSELIALLHAVETSEPLPKLPEHLQGLTDGARRKAIILEQGLYDDSRFKSHFYRYQ